MPGYDHLIAFFIATALFAAIPGPAVLYTAAQTLARGRRAGYLTVLGIHTGCYVHVFAATLGLSAVLTHVPTAYLVLKFCGAAYLIWIGSISSFAAAMRRCRTPPPNRRNALSSTA